MVTRTVMEACFPRISHDWLILESPEPVAQALVAWVMRLLLFLALRDSCWTADISRWALAHGSVKSNRGLVPGG